MGLNAGLAALFDDVPVKHRGQTHAPGVVPMSDVIEVSYTGDILAHRRCPRAWAYEKHIGFVPYEQVQAMEGRLLHHGIEWLSRQYRDTGILVNRRALMDQLERYYKVLRSRGITTAFTEKTTVLNRIVDNLYDGENMRRPVSAVVRGAEHTEYELRAVRKVLPISFGGKSRILLTGIIDLVLQQPDSLSYERVWRWDDKDELTGTVIDRHLDAQPGGQRDLGLQGHARNDLIPRRLRSTGRDVRGAIRRAYG